MIPLVIIAISIAVLFSGFFSASEIAYFALTDIKLKTLVRKKVKNSGYAKRLKSNPERLLTTILVYNDLVNIGTASIATFAMTEIFGSTGIGIATGIMTLVTLVFGDIIPKSIATRYSVQIVLRTAKLMYFLQILFFPIILIFEQVSKLPRLIMKSKQLNSQITAEDVVSMASTSFDQGEIYDYERDIITNVLDQNTTSIKRIMTPLSQMRMVESNMDLTQIISTVRKAHFSRIPVYKDNINNVVGFIFLRDILYIPKDQWKTLTAMDITREPLRVKETDKLHKVYRLLLKNRTHLVIVKNSEKKLVGMVTLEDIIEEVLGEIYDETDPR